MLAPCNLIVVVITVEIKYFWFRKFSTIKLFMPIFFAYFVTLTKLKLQITVRVYLIGNGICIKKKEKKGKFETILLQILRTYLDINYYLRVCLSSGRL